MSIIEEIKARFKKLSDKTPELRDEAVETIKKAGNSTMEMSRDLIQVINDKFLDITALTRIQRKKRALEAELTQEKLKMGKIGFKLLRHPDHLKNQDQEFKKQIENVAKVDNAFRKMTLEYEELRKERSDNYVIDKVSHELAEAGAEIDQVVISEKSNVVGKLLREIVLPKEALVSAIKRSDEIIIPDGNTQLLAGDSVTVIGKEQDVIKIVKRLGAAK